MSPYACRRLDRGELYPSFKREKVRSLVIINFVCYTNSCMNCMNLLKTSMYHVFRNAVKLIYILNAISRWILDKW